jgi:hypothetical protein
MWKKHCWIVLRSWNLSAISSFSTLSLVRVQVVRIQRDRMLRLVDVRRPKKRRIAVTIILHRPPPTPIDNRQVLSYREGGTEKSKTG